MKRDVLNSPRLSELKKRRQRVILNRAIFCVVAFFVIVFSLGYLSNVPALKIKDISVVGNKVLDTEAIKNIAEQQISGKYLWLFSKADVLYYGEGKIKKALEDNFQRIASIKLSVDTNRILSINITEREAKYMWCPDGATNQTGEGCYFLDQSGYVFDQAPYFSGEVYFKFYSTGDQPLGSYFIKSNFLQIVSFKDTLLSIGLKPIEFHLGENGDATIILSKATGPKIMFRMDSDFKNLAVNLQTALTTEPLQTQFKNKYSVLEYIDLRFGNKVYYKFNP